MPVDRSNADRLERRTLVPTFLLSVKIVKIKTEQIERFVSFFQFATNKKKFTGGYRTYGSGDISTFILEERLIAALPSPPSYYG